MGKAGNLLWHRMRVTITGTQDVDTLVTQNVKIFDAPNEPSMGVVEAGATPPAAGTPPASRIEVIPMAPLAAWANITHSEPYFDATTGTMHVTFVNGGAPAEINVLIWDPHSLIGPGQADTYHAFIG